MGSCTGDGETYPWNIDSGIAHVTNSLKGYNFNSTTTCSTVWPDLGGDWCWSALTSEIDLERPLVWSTGSIGWSGATGHSAAVYGYTDDHYVILYDTWGDGEEYLVLHALPQ